MKLKSIRGRKWLVPVIGIIAIGALFAVFTRPKEVESGQEARNVKAVKASMSSIVTDVEYASKLKAVHEVALSPKLGGKVASVNADVGKYVAKGQVLFTLDASEMKAQLSQQQAGLASASANLEKTRDSVLSQQVLQAEQALEKAEIAYGDRKASYSRVKKLFDAGVASKVELNDEKSRLDMSSLDLKNARDNLDSIKNKSGPQSVKAASAQVSQAQSGVDYVSRQLDGMAISSPISGVVAERNIEVGEMASSASPSFIVMDTEELIAQISVADSMLGNIKRGQKVSVKVNALPDRKFSGKIDSISPAADNKSMSYAVNIKIDNEKGELKPGMFARVVLPSEKRDNILTVPNESIVMENGISYVYVVDGGTVRKAVVKTGISNDKITEILSNLKEGDDIITEGQIFLSQGEAVNIVQ